MVNDGGFGPGPAAIERLVHRVVGTSGPVRRPRMAVVDGTVGIADDRSLAVAPW